MKGRRVVQKKGRLEEEEPEVLETNLTNSTPSSCFSSLKSSRNQSQGPMGVLHTEIGMYHVQSYATLQCEGSKVVACFHPFLCSVAQAFANACGYVRLRSCGALAKVKD